MQFTAISKFKNLIKNDKRKIIQIADAVYVFI
jgi:hypothetical protein